MIGQMIRNGVCKLAGVVLAALLSVPAGAWQAESSYVSQENQWRAEHEAQLKSDTGWLTVAGLFWLKEGSNTIGSSTFEMHQGRVLMRLAEGVQASFQGKPVSEVELTATTEKASSPVIVGDLSFLLLKRGTRYAVRLKDKNNPLRKEFTGEKWYPVNETYRVVAEFQPFESLRDLPITNVLGDTDNYRSPGLLRFRLKGKVYTLQPVIEGEKLFIIFNDLTTGKETYGGGRFLYAAKPSQGNSVVLDFNRAENPPCAFSEFTTCPLPPRQNRLKVTIEAGEIDYRGSHQGR
jgi:uncharacterized protein